MIPLGDVPVLLDSTRLLLPLYGRSLAHAARRAQPRLRAAPTLARKMAGALAHPTRRSRK